jgi:carbon monoxide dehydrogenase subunit G
MKFSNEIEVAQPPKELFAFLTDVERVAPCLPGASIDGREGDDYTGSMKVKVGPITGTYKGKMRFLEQDEDALRAVMSARAAEVNGQGDAEAKITTQIEEAGDAASRIVMETDLQMRGRVAQFGRGAMEKISQRMFDEFARNLEREMSGGGGGADAGEPAPEPEGDAGPAGEPRAEAAAETEKPAPAKPSAPAGGAEPQALDAMGMFVAPALRKAVPYAVPALVGLGYGYLLGRLRELRR